MAPTKTPDVGIPILGNVHEKRWSTGNGETETIEWSGMRSDVFEKYELEKSAGEAGANIASLIARSTNGRAVLTEEIGRKGQALPDFPEDTTVIEELYATDIIKDISEAPYFSQTLASSHHLFAEQDAATKGLPLNDDAVAFIRYCVENRFTEAEITTAAADKGLAAATYRWANWSTGMKELRYHMLRGVDSYYETGFILRQSVHGVRTAAVKASMAAINAVADGGTGRQPVPVFKSSMDQLILALPDGEWLYRPPQAHHTGKGRWRITMEWQWAEKWSIVYGGTFNL